MAPRHSPPSYSDSNNVEWAAKSWEDGISRLPNLGAAVRLTAGRKLIPSQHLKPIDQRRGVILHDALPGYFSPSLRK